MRSGPVQHQLCIPLPFGFPLNLDKRRRETPVPALPMRSNLRPSATNSWNASTAQLRVSERLDVGGARRGGMRACEYAGRTQLRATHPSAPTRRGPPMRGFEISDSSRVGDHHRLPALITANSVLAFATNRHTVAASSE